MLTLLPIVSGLSESHHLNLMIAAINEGPYIDEVFAASRAAAIIRFLRERPAISGAQEWIAQVEPLIEGVELHQPTVDNTYSDIVEDEGRELSNRKYRQ